MCLTEHVEEDLGTGDHAQWGGEVTVVVPSVQHGGHGDHQIPVNHHHTTGGLDLGCHGDVSI